MASTSIAAAILLTVMVVGAWAATWAGLAAVIAVGRGLPPRFGAVRGALAGPVGALWTLASNAPSRATTTPRFTTGDSHRNRELGLAMFIVGAFGVAAWSVTMGWVQGFTADQTAEIEAGIAAVSEEAAQLAQGLDLVEDDIVPAALAGGAASALTDSLLDTSRFTEISGLAVQGLGWASMAAALVGVVVAGLAALIRRGMFFVIFALIASAILTVVSPTAFAIQWLNFQAVPGVDRLPDTVRFYIPDPRIGPGYGSSSERSPRSAWLPPAPPSPADNGE